MNAMEQENVDHIGELCCFDGEYQVRFPLRYGSNVVGRHSRECNIVISTSRSISAKHAEISVGRDHFGRIQCFLRDLVSLNGTFLNGTHLNGLSGKVKLCHGDALRFGYDAASYYFWLTEQSSLSKFEDDADESAEVNSLASLNDENSAYDINVEPTIRPNLDAPLEGFHAVPIRGLIEKRPATSDGTRSNRSAWSLSSSSSSRRVARSPRTSSQLRSGSKANFNAWTNQGRTPPTGRPPVVLDVSHTFKPASQSIDEHSCVACDFARSASVRLLILIMTRWYSRILRAALRKWKQVVRSENISERLRKGRDLRLKRNAFVALETYSRNITRLTRIIHRHCESSDRARLRFFWFRWGQHIRNIRLERETRSNNKSAALRIFILAERLRLRTLRYSMDSWRAVAKPQDTNAGDLKRSRHISGAKLLNGIILRKIFRIKSRCWCQWLAYLTGRRLLHQTKLHSLQLWRRVVVSKHKQLQMRNKLQGTVVAYMAYIRCMRLKRKCFAALVSEAASRRSEPIQVSCTGDLKAKDRAYLHDLEEELRLSEQSAALNKVDSILRGLKHRILRRNWNLWLWACVETRANQKQSLRILQGVWTRNLRRTQLRALHNWKHITVMKRSEAYVATRYSRKAILTEEARRKLGLRLLCRCVHRYHQARLNHGFHNWKSILNNRLEQYKTHIASWSTKLARQRASKRMKTRALEKWKSSLENARRRRENIALRAFSIWKQKIEYLNRLHLEASRLSTRRTSYRLLRIFLEWKAFHARRQWQRRSILRLADKQEKMAASKAFLNWKSISSRSALNRLLCSYMKKKIDQHTSLGRFLRWKYNVQVARAMRNSDKQSDVSRTGQDITTTFEKGTQTVSQDHLEQSMAPNRCSQPASTMFEKSERKLALKILRRLMELVAVKSIARAFRKWCSGSNVKQNATQTIERIGRNRILRTKAKAFARLSRYCVFMSVRRAHAVLTMNRVFESSRYRCAKLDLLRGYHRLRHGTFLVSKARLVNRTNRDEQVCNAMMSMASIHRCIEVRILSRAFSNWVKSYRENQAVLRSRTRRTIRSAFNAWREHQMVTRRTVRLVNTVVHHMDRAVKTRLRRSWELWRNPRDNSVMNFHFERILFKALKNQRRWHLLRIHTKALYRDVVRVRQFLKRRLRQDVLEMFLSWKARTMLSKVVRKQPIRRACMEKRLAWIHWTNTYHKPKYHASLVRFMRSRRLYHLKLQSFSKLKHLIEDAREMDRVGESYRKRRLFGRWKWNVKSRMIQNRSEQLMTRFKIRIALLRLRKTAALGRALKALYVRRNESCSSLAFYAWRSQVWRSRRNRKMCERLRSKAASRLIHFYFQELRTHASLRRKQKMFMKAVAGRIVEINGFRTLRRKRTLRRCVSWWRVHVLMDRALRRQPSRWEKIWKRTTWIRWLRFLETRRRDQRHVTHFVRTRRPYHEKLRYFSRWRSQIGRNSRLASCDKLGNMNRKNRFLSRWMLYVKLKQTRERGMGSLAKYRLRRAVRVLGRHARLSRGIATLFAHRADRCSSLAFRAWKDRVKRIKRNRNVCERMRSKFTRQLFWDCFQSLKANMASQRKQKRFLRIAVKRMEQQNLLRSWVKWKLDVESKQGKTQRKKMDLLRRACLAWLGHCDSLDGGGPSRLARLSFVGWKRFCHERREKLELALRRHTANTKRIAFAKFRVHAKRAKRKEKDAARFASRTKRKLARRIFLYWVSSFRRRRRLNGMVLRFLQGRKLQQRRVFFERWHNFALQHRMDRLKIVDSQLKLKRHSTKLWLHRKRAAFQALKQFCTVAKAERRRVRFLRQIFSKRRVERSFHAWVLLKSLADLERRPVSVENSNQDARDDQRFTVLENVASRKYISLQRRGVRRLFQEWKHQLEAKQQRREKLSCFLNRWRRRNASAAFSIWFAVHSRTVRNQRIVASCLARIQNRTLSIAFAALLDYKVQSIRLKRMVARARNSFRIRAFGAWLGYCQREKRKRTIFLRVKNRSLGRALHAWKLLHDHRCNRRTEALRKASSKFGRFWVRACYQAWQDFVRLSHDKKSAMQRMVLVFNRIRNRVLFLGFVKWRDFVGKTIQSKMLSEIESLAKTSMEMEKHLEKIKHGKQDDRFRAIDGGGDESFFPGAFPDQHGDEAFPEREGEEERETKENSSTAEIVGSRRDGHELKKTQLLEKLLHSNDFAKTINEQQELIDTLHQELAIWQDREQKYLSDFVAPGTGDSSERGKKLVEQLRKIHLLERKLQDTSREAERQHEMSARELAKARQAQEAAQSELMRLQRYTNQKKEDAQNQIKVYENRLGKMNHLLAKFAHESDPAKAQKDALALLEAQIQTSIKAEAKARAKLKRYESTVTRLEQELDKQRNATPASLLLKELGAQVETLQAQVQDLRARGIVEAVAERQAKIEVVVRELNLERQRRQALERSLPVGHVLHVARNLKTKELDAP